MVKAQIHAGGRGKGGGVKLVKSIEELRAEAERMLGKPLVTPQTGPEGRIVRRIFVQRAANIARELYLSLLVDRATGRIAFVASSEGGMDIEHVAATTPEKILTIDIDPATGLTAFHTRIINAAFGLSGDQAKQCAKLLAGLYKVFIEKDASLIEINPLIVTEEGELQCLDAKINFDDNALFRHPDIAELRDLDEEDPAEVEASKHELVLYEARRQHRLHGEWRRPRHGHHGHHQALWRGAREFSRCRRRRHQGEVTEAFKIILSDPNVKGILSIFSAAS